MGLAATPLAVTSTCLIGKVITPSEAQVQDDDQPTKTKAPSSKANSSQTDGRASALRANLAKRKKQSSARRAGKAIRKGESSAFDRLDDNSQP